MRIGIIAEGSYPYIKGGVSSWVQMLMKNMPDVEFEIIAISAGKSSSDTYKYELPANVKGITNIPLNGLQKPKLYEKVKLSDKEKRELFHWSEFNDPYNKALHLFADRRKIGSAKTFFRSSAFWNFVVDHYQQEDNQDSFIDYLMMWQSILMPVLTLLQNQFPNVDLVHSISTGYAGQVGAYMKETQNIPFIITEHGMYAREREEEIIQTKGIPSQFKQKWINFFYHVSNQAYQQADDIITLFQSNSNFQKRSGAPKERLRVIPNGIELEKFTNAPMLNKVNEKFKIGAIVRVVPIKDIKTMIHAAYYLKKYGVPFELTIMGPVSEDPKYAKECDELIKSLNLTQEVLLSGEVNVLEYLPRFDVCVLSSISEGQPLAILEGMAAGIPWVTTNVGACSELIKGGIGDSLGDAGFVIPPVNPEAMALKCKWLYEHPTKRKEMGSNGKKRVKEFYQLTQVIQHYSTLYQERSAMYGGDRVSP
ncbi:GT4 family glycosyltransferase PelF [Halobacillus litoralis]|uniref:GT4 family glycosyltransferase PelF n=1 Tax=Halobacillus litoralis TaxID=45668 RepID=UPI001CFD5626|nr:GT4 family glycosyltransferase PelF [Halobacillus litoralis]